MAGPWTIEELPGRGWGLYHPGTSAAAGDQPYAVFAERWHAQLAAAALHVAEALLRSPWNLATLLEAAGQVALERSGAILDGRV